MKQTNRRQGGGAGGGSGGFTLIEVVLVLAIGGLIFLLAFLAFQQATKNRRDSQRRSDAARVISEIENAKGDAGGTAFTSSGGTGSFVVDYLSGSSSDTNSGEFVSNNITYTIQYSSSRGDLADDVTSSTGDMIVAQNARCSGTSFSSGGPGDYAVLARLEKGVACRDNQ